MGGDEKLKSQTQNPDLDHHNDGAGSNKITKKFDDPSEFPPIAPIFSSYNDRIRPLLDDIDRLRNLGVVIEGIELPTIVVIGDQSSGKSSVLDSLARISLPRREGICTRLPLVLRFQNHTSSVPEFRLEHNKSKKSVDIEEHITSGMIDGATEIFAGDGKGISKFPFTITVKKKEVSDLTMVDLPGISSVPVHGQPANIYDQIKDIIMEYVQSENSIILNVLSATVDFPTSESVQISQSVDRDGERTLAVITKCDMAPQGFLEKVADDEINTGLGYVCVRTRVGGESYEEARFEESKLFQTHPELSKIHKSIVGIPALAQKIMQIQANIILRNLPDIKDINYGLNKDLAEFDKLPMAIHSVAEAMGAFMKIMGVVKVSLGKILLRGEYDDYRNEKKMHCKARLVEMLNSFSDELMNSRESDLTRDFLMDEIRHLTEVKDISLPKFLPGTDFLALLQEKVEGVSIVPIKFVRKLWDYIEEPVMTVFKSHFEDYHKLQLSTKKAGLNLIEKMKERSTRWVMEAVEMEKLTDYTCNPEFESEWNKLMAQKDSFMANTKYHNAINIEGLGMVEVGNNAKKFPHLLHHAYDLRMRMVAYWKIVVRRLVDNMALHIRLSVHKFVNEEFEKEIVSELMGAHNENRMKTLMEESPYVATKRLKLVARVKKLTESKEILATIMDRFATTN
ncbi:dynamin-related protein 4C-like [Humulus lupulus]|uniref:dynamin-related protein 4C-like n=1 Tax=Humulus lupulus TaxID=3486 RepID=UPI002B415815|nr:dynamin-related protein 4C-like [Humulus lupulus]